MAVRLYFEFFYLFLHAIQKIKRKPGTGSIIRLKLNCSPTLGVNYVTIRSMFIRTKQELFMKTKYFSSYFLLASPSGLTYNEIYFDTSGIISLLRIVCNENVFDISCKIYSKSRHFFVFKALK